LLALTSQQELDQQDDDMAPLGDLADELHDPQLSTTEPLVFYSRMVFEKPRVLVLLHFPG
jgi:hypothetical protein